MASTWGSDDAHSHGIDEDRQRDIPCLVQKVVRRKGVVGAVLEIEPDDGFTSRTRLADLERDSRGIVHWRLTRPQLGAHDRTG